MAKLTILAVALIALLALAQATLTTITTTVEEEENPGQQQRCREQIQRQQNLHHCQMHLQEQARGYDMAMNPQQQHWPSSWRTSTSSAALLALAHATRTTITTTVVEEENPGQQQRCREQIQRQQNLHDCQRYLQQQAREYEVAMITNQNPQQQQQLRQCCQQLENLDDQCRCEGIREAVRQ
ncbi:hypothetical protein RHGRI_018542 [Rhododendron griersonianum]|uniref:Uncharacterized protein n=1 Tax=Rhododendron griersonianum TaxID=479676 RepID=A0AAV6K1S2_9ERIC|nr:hypothetical protein RHGRI_018542 [Rhododendron griersonianum]